MTTTTATQCRTADLILHADQVLPGDLMLVRGVLASVEAVETDTSQAAYICLTVAHVALSSGPHKVWMLAHGMAAVRRYVTEGE